MGVPGRQETTTAPSTRGSSKPMIVENHTMSRNLACLRTVLASLALVTATSASPVAARAEEHLMHQDRHLLLRELRLETRDRSEDRPVPAAPGRATESRQGRGLSFSAAITGGRRLHKAQLRSCRGR